MKILEHFVFAPTRAEIRKKRQEEKEKKQRQDAEAVRQQIELREQQKRMDAYTHKTSDDDYYGIPPY